VEKGKITINIHDLKKWGDGKWKKIDDKPFGGGAGMLLQIEPIYKALKEIGVYPDRDDKTKVVLTSARGDQWDQDKVVDYRDKLDRLIIICGHYEGVDYRVVEHLIDGEVRIGNYILSGGEIAASVIVDTIARTVPGVVGNEESILDETSFQDSDIRTSEYPQYTRPENFVNDEGEEWSAPEILLSGNHAEIEKWREKNRKTSKS
jgi:tRNA (guanine37-N1)-methyltransferase